MSKKGDKEKGSTVKPTKPTKVNKGRKPSPKPAPKKPKKKTAAPRISAATYNKLQEAYFERQSINHAAKAAKVSFKTAKAYIDGPGKPDVGLVPIKQLWLDIQVEAQERRQLTLVKFQEDQVGELEQIVKANMLELKLIGAEISRRVDKYNASGQKDIETGASMATAMKSYERSVKLMEHLLGKPDLTVRHEGEDRYANWSDEEIILFMETGKLPDHVR